MRILQNITIALFVVVALAKVATDAYISRAVDRIPPVITCASDVVEAKVGASDTALLSGVTATDNKDGDLTSQVMIKGVSKLITADTAKVTYIVFDSSNNMSTAQRTVHYTNYEKPKISLSHPLIYSSDSSIRLLQYLSAYDVVDGDISGKIRVTTQNVSAYDSDTYNVTIDVTNSLGDVESVPLKVIIRDQLPSTPPLTLSEYISYLKSGDSFSPTSYIVTPSKSGAVKVNSTVDTATPGAYQVSYTYENYTVYQTVIVR